MNSIRSRGGVFSNHGIQHSRIFVRGKCQRCSRTDLSTMYPGRTDAVPLKPSQPLVAAFPADTEQIAYLGEVVLVRLVRNNELHSESGRRLLQPRHSTLPHLRSRKVSTMFPDRSVNNVPGSYRRT